MSEEKHTVSTIRKEWYKDFLIVLIFNNDGTGDLRAIVYSNDEKPKDHIFTYNRFFCAEEEVLSLTKSKIDKIMKPLNNE